MSEGEVEAGVEKGGKGGGLLHLYPIHIRDAPPVTVPGTPEWPLALLPAMNREMSQREAVSSLRYIWDSPPCSGAVGTSGLMDLSSRITDTEVSGSLVYPWSRALKVPTKHPPGQ